MQGKTSQQYIVGRKGSYRGKSPETESTLLLRTLSHALTKQHCNYCHVRAHVLNGTFSS